MLQALGLHCTSQQQHWNQEDNRAISTNSKENDFQPRLLYPNKLSIG